MLEIPPFTASEPMRVLQPSALSIILILSATLPAAGVAQPPLPTHLTGLDPVSAACVSCHDGTAGSRAGFCLLWPDGSQGDGHVISARYDELAAHNQGLTPPASLPPEIVLHEGYLTCGSCHGSDPHAGAPLVIDNRNSALCRTCHRK